MTNSISIYNFNQNQIRTQAINGELWFCLLDCRAALEIKGSLKKVSLSEKGVTICHTLTNGGKQNITFINEPNLYRLIFRSNKPQAQAFADWVYSEVLPSIRKTGKYAVSQNKPVVVSEHTRSLPSGKKEIVLSEQYAPVDMKAIGGVVKKCVAVAVRDELSKLLSGDKTDNWEVSDKDLIYYLYNWHLTKNKKDAEMFRKLNATVDRLMAENAGLKEAIKNTKAVLRNW